MFKFIYLIIIFLGMFLTVCYKKVFQYIKKSSNVIENFKRLKIKENITNEVKIFYYQKIKMIGLVCLVCGSLGIISCVMFKEDEIELSKLIRPSYSEVSKDYQIEVLSGGKSDKIKLNITAKEYSIEEARKICEEALEEWKKVFCGNNESLNEIVSNVNLPDSINNYDVSFEYFLSENSYIDYEGNIDFDNAIYIDGKCNASLMVVCYLGEYHCENNVEYSIIEPDKSLESKIQDAINKQSKYNEQVDLPKNIDSEKLSYFNIEEDNYNWIFLVLAIVMAVVIYIGKDSDISKEVKKRDEQLRLDYAELVSMFSLLQYTGQSIKNTWNKIIDSYDGNKSKRYVYEEMKLVKNKIDNGILERKAYQEFGRRCGIREYIKFANIIEQNLLKGSNSIKSQLKLEVMEASKNKITLAKKKAEECSTKLLVPMVMMLIIAMAILIVPAFLNMNI
ncbi:MAG: hypothetical protein E7270_02915 [Lachnospiraceae bacterium]|nr:hypothetical protein [Lachnospiraceae bacterium]